MITIGFVFVAVIIQLEVNLHTLWQDFAALQADVQIAYGDIDSYRSKIGDLARRQAQAEFKVENPPDSGLIDIECCITNRP